ncbi:MAG: tetratricopeptide repeat protein [Candidatus Hydrogenedentes bacterium]|nr:tetratricopeptide repeat protein [Candidatus Hydrogenedentota bacterium]
MSDNIATPPATVLPKSAYETFLVLCGAAFLLVAAVIFAYGRYGSVLADGLDEACAEAAFLSGQRLEALGNNDQAIRRYRQALEGRFSDPERRHMCGRAIGDLLVRENRFTEAVEAYTQLPVEAFSAAGAYTGYVTALWREGRFTEAGQLGNTWLKKAQEAQDTTQQAWACDALMRICEQTGRLEEALAHGMRAVELQPASSVRLDLARLFQRLGRSQEAREQVEQLLSVSQDTQILDAARKLLPTIS